MLRSFRNIGENLTSHKFSAEEPSRYDQTWKNSIPATSPDFPGVFNFFIKSLNLPLEHQISREIPTAAFCQNCFIHFVIFEMSKRKIKQEVDFVLLFELFSIGKCKTERSNCKKLTRFSYTVYVSLAKMAVGHIRKPCG